MNRFIMEEFYNDPALGRRLYEATRRERTRAVRAGLARLFGHLKTRLTPRHRPPRWIERLG